MTAVRSKRRVLPLIFIVKSFWMSPQKPHLWGAASPFPHPHQINGPCYNNNHPFICQNKKGLQEQNKFARSGKKLLRIV